MSKVGINTSTQAVCLKLPLTLAMSKLAMSKLAMSKLAMSKLAKGMTTAADYKRQQQDCYKLHKQQQGQIPVNDISVNVETKQQLVGVFLQQQDILCEGLHS